MARSISTVPETSFPLSAAWMSRPWRIRSVTSVQGVTQTDILLFTTPGKIKIRKNGASQEQEWGTSCQLTPNGLTGRTSSENKPFLIQLDPATRLLTCQVQDPASIGPANQSSKGGPSLNSGLNTGQTWVAEEGGAGGPRIPPGEGTTPTRPSTL